MIWIVTAILLGLALGVGAVLVLARPYSIHSAHKKSTGKTSASIKPAAPLVKIGRPHDKPSAADRAVRLPLQVVPPVAVASSHGKPPGLDRPADFPEVVVIAAWRRQGGLCAQCGRLLIWANRDRDSGIGAWQSHHRTARDQGGISDLKNCVLFCSGVANCHFNIGHGGIGWNHYSPLEDSGLLYLRCGAEKGTTTGPQTRTKPGLIGEVFGILVPGRGKRPSVSKPNAKRSRPSLSLEDDYDGAC